MSMPPVRASDQAPPVDSARDVFFRDTVGNKGDAAVTTVGTTASIVAYLKGLINLVKQALGLTQVAWEKSDLEVVEGNNGRVYVAVGVVDLDDGSVPSDDIDITGATITLARSTSGGAFDATGITQPSLTKATGVIESTFQLDSGEWSIGDKGRIQVSGVQADDSDGNTYNAPLFTWLFHVVDVATLVQNAADAKTASEAAQAASETLRDDRLTAARAGFLDDQWRSELVSAVNEDAVGDSEVTLLDKGDPAEAPRFRLDSAFIRIVNLGSNTELVFRVYSEINGTLREVAGVTQSSTGVFDLMGAIGGVFNAASRHIRVTVTGDNAANDGDVEATFATSTAGVT